MIMNNIRFGTDGWRAKMGKDFTFKNVRIFSAAFVNYLKKRYKSNIKVLLNYDTRFLSKNFAKEAGKILSINKIKVVLPYRDTPIPAFSYAIVKNKYNAGIMFTASFNRPICNGIKIFNNKGLPAMPSETSLIEMEVEKISKSFRFEYRYEDEDFIEFKDLRENYINYLEDIIDFDLIRNSKIKIVVDSLYGTSREYLDFVLLKNDIDVFSIHNYTDSFFGGVIPSCTKENLKDLSEIIIEKKYDIGLSTDIDSDRFGIIDSKGRFLSSNIIIPPLIDYLISVRRMEGGIVKSITTTNNIDNVAKFYSRKVYETPVGFKFLGDILQTKKVFIGVESTNGAALNYKIKTKDGILFSLLIAEMLAYYKEDMDKILKRFYKNYPKLISKEIHLKINAKRVENFEKFLKNDKILIMGKKPVRVSYIDGIKIYYSSNTWLAIRKSGTDNLIRIYAESPDNKILNKIIQYGRNIIEG